MKWQLVAQSDHRSISDLTRNRIALTLVWMTDGRSARPAQGTIWPRRCFIVRQVER